MLEANAHYFYALALPNETKTKLKDICENLQTSYPFKRWVHHQDHHITLAFLGSASEEQLQTSLRNMESMLECSAFSLAINHLGVFGKKETPRIFWAGVNDEPQLKQVRGMVYHACQLSGFTLETRAFNPHITLARKWNGDLPFNQQMLEDNTPFMEPFQFQAENIVLYKTHLGKEPKYEPLFTFPLSRNE